MRGLLLVLVIGAAGCGEDDTAHCAGYPSNALDGDLGTLMDISTTHVEVWRSGDFMEVRFGNERDDAVLRVELEGPHFETAFETPIAHVERVVPDSPPLPRYFDGRAHLTKYSEPGEPVAGCFDVDFVDDEGLHFKVRGGFAGTLEPRRP